MSELSLQDLGQRPSNVTHPGEFSIRCITRFRANRIHATLQERRAAEHYALDLWHQGNSASRAIRLAIHRLIYSMDNQGEVCKYEGTPPFADAAWAHEADAMCLWCAGTGHPYGDPSYGMCTCP